MLPSRCYDCSERTCDERYILLHCECEIALCKNCARYRLASEQKTYRGVLKCPKCAHGAVSFQSDGGVKQIFGVEKAMEYEKELLHSAFQHFNLAATTRNARER